MPGWLITIMAMAASPGMSAAGGPVVLENEHLRVRFEASEAGPRLASMESIRSGAVHRFEQSEAISLALVPLDAVHDPALQVRYGRQKDFEFIGATTSSGRNEIVLRFENDSLRCAVTYELDPDRPALHKRIACEVREQGGYVAGVRLWMVRPIELNRVWPE